MMLDALLHGDNLAVMRELPTASVDLAYLDPPYCTGRDFGAFSDRWTDPAHDIRHLSIPASAVADLAGRVHSESMALYVGFMAVRLLEVRRLLKSSGSIYVHVDPTADSYVRVLMDATFGRSWYRNAIAWCYTGPSCVRKHFPRKHDTILLYSGEGAVFNRFDVCIPYKSLSPDVTFKKQAWLRSGHNSCMGTAVHRMTPERRQEYIDRGKIVEDFWTDIHAMGNVSESAEYPTQKPLALLDRIVRASSDPGGVVLDPMCGSGTALVAAHRLGRRYVGIDENADALRICAERLKCAPESIPETVTPPAPEPQLALGLY